METVAMQVVSYWQSSEFLVIEWRGLWLSDRAWYVIQVCMRTAQSCRLCLCSGPKMDDTFSR